MRPIRIVLLALVSAVVASIAAYAIAIRPWLRSWGADETEAQMPLPGDDLVAAPTAAETRAISIVAPPAAVCRWLAQLGDGRGGWYSSASRGGKRASATTILPEFQPLTPGDKLSV